jgi:hypothetical protein
MSLRWRDVEGKSSQLVVPMYFDAADVPTLADAQTTFTKYETLLHALSGCVIAEAEVVFPLTLAGTESPDAGYRTRTGATLSFINSDEQGDSIYVPGILDDKIIDGIVDSSDSDVADFITEATGGGTTDPLSTRGSGSLWTDYEGGKQTNRKV